MYELTRAGEKSWYLESPAKIGIYQQSETDVYLIDSGSDKDAGRRVRKALDEQGWTCRGVLVTHSNADHTGGCQYLQKQYGCPVFSAGIEAAFCENPLLEPSFLYGAFPYAGLRNKFLMAQSCTVTPFTDAAFPKEVEVIPLPGHFFQMVGFRLPDGTVFVADSLASSETLAKYRVTFLYDVEAYLQTLDLVAGMKGTMLVPSHAAPGLDLTALCEENKAAVLQIAEDILSVCTEGMIFEDILKALFDRYGLALSESQYVLVGSTVRSYLSWLKNTGRMEILIAENRLLWKTV